MRTEDKPLAILCSDIHLSHVAPAARRGEPNWYDAMTRGLRQLRALQQSLNNVVIICAGDIFDRWNSPPELINFALCELPDMWAIPGQHDLPLHNYDSIGKSAFWTLVMAGKIEQLDNVGKDLGPFMVYGFPWGREIEPPDYNYTSKNLAVVHSFIWTDDYGYPGAPTDALVNSFRKKLEGYSAAVFGDNHKGFLVDGGKPYILNCGTFFRRKSDEIDYRPSVGVLHRSGKIVRHFLDTDSECIEKVEDRSEGERAPSFDEFIKQLSGLAADPLSFVEALDRVMGKCSDGVRRVLQEALDGR